ncbi:MAG: hypothetical protein AAF720_04330 [Pseudomonadota bacterium]
MDLMRRFRRVSPPLSESLFGLTRICSVFVTAALVVSCATTPGERVNSAAQARFEKYELTGEKRQCLPLTTVREIVPITETKFLVRANAKQYYLNEVNGRCAGATAIGTFLTYRLSINQLCRLEIVQVIDQTAGGIRGACSLGDFQTLKPKDEKPKDQKPNDNEERQEESDPE